MKKISNLINYIKELNALNKNSVVIYQMGKVGSSSIEKTLLKHGVHVIHSHKFTPENVYFYDLSIVSKFKKVAASIRFFITQYFFKIKACKVITIVRDPIDRNLSQMFHHIDLLIYERTKLDSRREVSANELFQEIFENDINLKYAEEWFEKEFYRATGFNYQRLEFDIEEGYGLAKQKEKEFLFLRFENLNSLESVIGDFCKIEDFKLDNTNRSTRKWYSDLYTEFKSHLKVGDESFNLIYNNKFYNKFYGDVSKAKSKWLKSK